jgi:hypothetical protein
LFELGYRLEDLTIVSLENIVHLQQKPLKFVAEISCVGTATGRKGGITHI